jgi:short-subunit dehydrogenase involved in D-alanine esterification of teichoic acids
MILTALRTFYMMAAYGWVSDVDDLEGASELLEVLKKTYGAGNENIVNNSISLNIDLRIDYMGATVLSGIDSLADNEDDDEDDDEE